MCGRGLFMPTNLAIDDRLINEARRVGRHEEYIAHRKRLGVLRLFGTVDFDPAWDYKADRQRRKK